jgi:two-component system CheB/CheR fusion protein
MKAKPMTGRNARQAGQARPQVNEGALQKRGVDFPVVGLGASAGGLDSPSSARGTSDTVRRESTRIARQVARRRPGFGELTQRALLEAYAPASVLINENHEGLYYFGKVDGYLKIVSGEDTRDVLAMAREGLRAKLRLAIRRARQNHARVTITGMQVERNGCSIRVSITAQPVECDTGGLLLVSFIDDLEPGLRPARPVETAKDASRVAQLERELEATCEDLQSAIRDLDIANEEQMATSEEAVTFNADVQSTN